MRKLLTAAVLALALPIGASAQISLGAKVGVAFPMGDAAKDSPMKDFTSLAVPIELNVSYEVVPNFDLGVYGSYAFAKQSSDVTDLCDLGNGDCSEHIWRLGLKGEYAIAMSGNIVPFVGASFGWEWDVTKTKFDVIDTDLKSTVSGWEFGLEGGADMKVSEKLKVGAFVGLSFGQYGKFKEKGTFMGVDVDDSGDITDKAMHEWLTIGVRGRFGL